MRWKTKLSCWAGSVLATFDAHPFMLVCGIGLGLRLLAVASLGDAVYDQGGDGVRYLSIARDVLEGRPYGSTTGDYTRVPLYQFFLAAHVWLFGERLVSVALTQAVLGTMTAVVLILIARAIVSGTRTWFIGLIWATYPPAILNTVILFPQTLQVFWIVLAFWLLIASVVRGSMARCAGAAVCWGLACLTRSGPLLFLPVFSLGPLLLWRLRERVGWRWTVTTSVVMLLTGFLSVVWWTARDFSKTYRLEYLFLNGHERNVMALLLRPVEPAHARLAQALRRWTQAATSATPSISTIPVIEVRTLSHFNAGELDPVTRRVAFDAMVHSLRRELGRFTIKLQQALGAPDGCVQLRCTGPPGGYWATFRADITDHPLRVAAMAVGEPCMALKVLMYIQHYLLLVAVVPGLVILFRRAPGVTMLFVLYAAYTSAGIVFTANYSETVAAVPRYAFSLMPVLILVTGLVPLAYHFGSGQVSASEVQLQHSKV